MTAPGLKQPTRDIFPIGRKSRSDPHAAQPTTACIAANAVDARVLPGLLRGIHRSLTGLDLDGVQGGPDHIQSAKSRLMVKAAVDIRKSVFPDHLVCLEDGKRVTMLKRHLNTAHGLTPEGYRTRWGLPATYPMVAPNYAKTRSCLAKASGLGKRGRAE